MCACVVHVCICVGTCVCMWVHVCVCVCIHLGVCIEFSVCEHSCHEKEQMLAHPSRCFLPVVAYTVVRYFVVLCGQIIESMISACFKGWPLTEISLLLISHCSEW